MSPPRGRLLSHSACDGAVPQKLIELIAVDFACKISSFFTQRAKTTCNIAAMGHHRYRQTSHEGYCGMICMQICCFGKEKNWQV